MKSSLYPLPHNPDRGMYARMSMMQAAKIMGVCPKRAQQLERCALQKLFNSPELRRLAVTELDLYSACSVTEESANA